MNEYTKEQEAEALAWVEKGSFCKPDLNIVLAMAKRTAEAEEAFARLIADRDYVRSVVTFQRDALKARVAELERALSEADNDRDALRDMVRETPAPLVIVTRELLEMMLADAETRAVYGRGDVPLNPAARLVVALRKMLEAKP